MAETEVCFSLAGTEELDAVCAIEKKSFGVEGFSRRQLRYLMTRSKGAFYVARMDGAVVAYLSLLIPGRSRLLRIYSVAVTPEVRGSGVGAALVDLAKAYARERGLKAVSLEVNTTNRPAIGLYRKKGFLPRKLLKAYYPDGADACRMCCLL